VPSAADQQSTGTLVYDATKGAQLVEIIGPLAPAQPQLGPGPEVILGYDHSGARFTCVQSYYCGHQTNQANLNVATMDIELVLKGRHFNTREEIRFQRFQCDYSNLHAWLFGLLPFRVSYPNDTAISIELLRGDLWDVTVGEGLRLRNSYSRTGYTSAHPDQEFTLGHLDSLWATYDSGVQVETFCRHQRIFRTLIDLLGHCQLQVAAVKAGLTDAGTDTEIFYHSYFARNARGDADRDRMPVRYTEVQERFNHIVESWFTLFPQFNSIVSLYFLGEHSRGLTMENLFLGVLQAVEAFHRTFYSGVYISADQYEQQVRPILVNAIPPGLDPPFRQSLIARLRFGYEHSLRNRLRELLATLPETAAFAGARNTEFLARTVNTRNRLTHVVVEPEDTFEGAALYNAIKGWQEVLVALLFARIDLTPEEIDRAVRRMQSVRGTFVQL
jgi:hypothetical protein